jgi:hypothetical protein
MWQPLIGPTQQQSATWHFPIGPRQQVGPTLAQTPDRWAPPTCHVAGHDRTTSASPCHLAARQQHTLAKANPT